MSLPAAASTPSATTIPPLPPPDTFDILPPLHELLARLLNGPGANAAHNSALGADRAYPTAPPLDIQQLASAVSAVRARIRKAREAVAGLEDVGRDIAEQEAEIRALRAREAEGLRVLAGLAGQGT